MTDPTITPAPIVAPLNSFPTLDCQPYDSYLPMAFDDNLTLLQKVNAIINYMNNLGTTMNAVTTDWTQVTDWVMGSGLTTAVDNELNTMMTNGQFSTYINGTVFQGFSTKLANLHIDITDYKSYVPNYNTVTDVTQWDWSAALTQAVNDAISQNKTLIFFPEGYYQIGTTVNIPDVINLAGVYTTKTFSGQVKGGSVIVGNNTTTAPILKVTSSTGKIIGFGLSNLNFLGADAWDESNQSKWVDRSAIELDGVCRSVKFMDVTISGFKRGAVTLNDVYDGDFIGLTIIDCGSDGVYPALNITGTSGDNSNALKFYGLHMEFCPYMLYIGGASRHIQFLGGKFEVAVGGNNPPIVIDSTANEVNFISPQLVHLNVSDYVAAGFTGGQYMFQIKNGRTQIKDAQAVSPPNTGFDGALWIDHSAGDGGQFSDNIFSTSNGTNYAFKIGNNAHFKNNTVEVLTDKNGNKNGIQLNQGNDVRGNLWTDSSGKTVTAGIQYHLLGTQNIIEDHQPGILFHQTWDGSLSNILRVKGIIQQIASNASVIDVSGIETIRLNPSVATTITNFTGGYNGQQLTIFADNANTTLANNTTLIMKAAADLALTAGQVVKLFYNGTAWYQE